MSIAPKHTVDYSSHTSYAGMTFSDVLGNALSKYEDEEYRRKVNKPRTGNTEQEKYRYSAKLFRPSNNNLKTHENQREMEKPSQTGQSDQFSGVHERLGTNGVLRKAIRDLVISGAGTSKTLQFKDNLEGVWNYSRDLPFNADFDVEVINISDKIADVTAFLMRSVAELGSYAEHDKAALYSLFSENMDKIYNFVQSKMDETHKCTVKPANKTEQQGQIV